MSFQKNLVCHYYILELRIVEIFEKCFFSCLGILRLLMIEWMRNALFFFWFDIFLFWNSVFFNFFWDIQKCVFFRCLGISCLLMFEWMWNALFFFWSDIFLLWDLVFFQFFWNITATPKVQFISLLF